MGDDTDKPLDLKAMFEKSWERNEPGYRLLADDAGGEIVRPCPKGGTCLWGIDGQHGNRYCKKCFTPHPSEAP